MQWRKTYEDTQGEGLVKTEHCSDVLQKVGQDLATKTTISKPNGHQTLGQRHGYNSSRKLEIKYIFSLF